jgi:hypothetical protein
MHVAVPADRRVVLEMPESVHTDLVEVIILVPSEAPRAVEEASPEALARWDAAAAELAADPRPFRELSDEERWARLNRLRGVGKGLFSSSDEFAESKREEIELEDRKFGH